MKNFHERAYENKSHIDDLVNVRVQVVPIDFHL